MNAIRTSLLSLTIVLCLNVHADSGMMIVWDSQMNNMVDFARTVSINAAIPAKSKKKAKRTESVGKLVSGTFAPAATAPRASALLRFTPSPAISQRIKKNFTKTLVRANPQSREEIERKLSRQDVISDFAHDMAPYGLRADDIADAMTAYWITMWMIANQEPAPAIHKVSVVQRKIRTSMLQDPTLINAIEGERQEITEGLIYETMMAFGMLTNATPDPMKLKQLADDAQRNMLKNGVDLQSLRLTSSGFISS